MRTGRSTDGDPAFQQLLTHVGKYNMDRGHLQSQKATSAEVPRAQDSGCDMQQEGAHSALDREIREGCLEEAR